MGLQCRKTFKDVSIKILFHKNYELIEVTECVQKFLSSSWLFKNRNIEIYRTIIFRFVLNGCEIWSLTLRDERRLWVFENRVLRGIYGPKKDEVNTGAEKATRIGA